MTGRLALLAAVTCALLTPVAPAQAAPQCQYGENVTADCAGGQCPDVSAGQATPCLGIVLDPLFPPGPPVKVGLEGGIGIGAG